MAIQNRAKLSSYITAPSGEQVELQTNSNKSVVNNLNTDIIIAKTSSKSWILPSGKVTITNTITNNTDVNISDINIKDTISAGASFLSGSVKIGSVEHPDYNIETGFVMPVTLGGSGGELTLSYDIVADDYAIEESFDNQSTISFEIDNNTFELSSSTLNIQIINNDVSLLKTASRTAVKTGDTLTYTIEITNSGNFKNTNIVFTDKIPDGTEFVANSVTINGEAKEGFNPENSFELPELDINGSITVTFKVTVK